MEREEGRLQLRYVLAIGEGVCDVEVEETDEAVTVFGFICSGEEEEPVDISQLCECPVHVYLERPLGAGVVDGHLGRDVPYKNVYAEMDDEPA